ncbi:MAG: hypothetical protein GXO63_00480 [Candidatus Micrarchaeota archaeon]|nr:hypothetical protein [Candidatus Micrarchaeota archaeon]
MKVLHGRKRKAVIDYLNSLFGIPVEELEKYVYLASGEKIWITGKIEKVDIQRLEAETVGLGILRRANPFKPTTAGVQFFAKFIKKSVVDVNDEELERLLKGFDIPNRFGASGYVVFRYRGDIIGVGRASVEKIKNMIPKSRRIPLGKE